MRKPRQTKETLLIICEGEKTEPIFFHAIRSEIKGGKYPTVHIGEIKIIPEPKIDSPTVSSRSARKPREVKPDTQGQTDKIMGQPPLKWVQKGYDELQDRTYDEVWAVFDKDEHPAAKEAFELAKQEVNGKHVHIAFSSRCFEYYLLLHFEKKYYAFQKSECKDENKKVIGCGTTLHPANDCHGVRCINGYAREKGYWQETKKNQSTYNIIKDRLQLGFAGATWLRNKSDKCEGEKPVYQRNPMIWGIDTLVQRLTGEGREWTFINRAETKPIGDIEISFDKSGDMLLKNISKATLVIPQGVYEVVSYLTGEKEEQGERILLGVGESISVPLSQWDIDSDKFVLFHCDDRHVVVFASE
ncbi:MAG: RloB family protein [Mediterranea sp.]|jgi:hypothetical protein|nr:RloB family protein [Mediterranea sp.]